MYSYNYAYNHDLLRTEISQAETLHLEQRRKRKLAEAESHQLDDNSNTGSQQNQEPQKRPKLSDKDQRKVLI